MVNTTPRLEAMLAANREFAEALGRGERWAVQRAEAIAGLDGLASRQHPERAFTEDGKTKRNWCGSCPFEEGCVQCDLDWNHEVFKEVGGKYKD